MFKTVNFNIFEENLADLVYREDFADAEKNNYQPEKAIERSIQKTTEIIIKPLGEPPISCHRKTI